MRVEAVMARCWDFVFSGRRIERRGRCEVTSSCVTIVVTSASPQWRHDCSRNNSLSLSYSISTRKNPGVNTHNGGTDRNSTKHRSGESYHNHCSVFILLRFGVWGFGEINCRGKNLWRDLRFVEQKYKWDYVDIDCCDTKGRLNMLNMRLKLHLSLFIYR